MPDPEMTTIESLDDPDVDAIADEQLPDDDEELAAPPPADDAPVA